jgi:hypothetical protein
MEETFKSIRNKMYLLIQSKGAVLHDSERKEIKAIMQEYRNLKHEEEKEIIPQELPKEKGVDKKIERVERRSDWKPYPVN